MLLFTHTFYYCRGLIHQAHLICVLGIFIVLNTLDQRRRLIAYTDYGHSNYAHSTGSSF